MAVTSTPSFSSFYYPPDPNDITTLSGSSFDTKIGYQFRAAATRDLYVILQDIEGTPLTDSSGDPLVSLIDGFVTSELTSDKALGVVLPTIPEEKQVLDFVLFGDEFEVRRRQPGADPETGGDIPPYVEITNPQGGYKYIAPKDTIEMATGASIFRDLYDDGDPRTLIQSNAFDGREYETFTINEIQESIDANGNLLLKFILNKDPLNTILKTDTPPVSLIRKKLTLTRSGVVKIEEVFPSTSEVSSTLLGIDRAETQLGLFSNVSTYGLNPDEFVYYTDNNNIGPIVWTQRETEREGPHYQSRIEEVGNEGALRISSFPVPYTFPYPPLSQVLDADGNNVNGLFSEERWIRWQNWLKLGKALYEYFRNLRDLSINSPIAYQKYNYFITRFLPAINIWDDATFYSNQYFGGSTTQYYRQISIWTDTWRLINSGEGEIYEPVTNERIGFGFIFDLALTLRGTGTDTTIDAGAIATGTPNEGASSPETYLNPYREEWLNKPFISANAGGVPVASDFVPGYSPVGGQYALLQSRQAFRYQPGRISGYTFGTRATMAKDTAGNFAEWGIFNDFDEYVFRRDGANFYIVRRSTVHLPLSSLQELGVADQDGNEDISLVKYYDKTIADKVYSVQEISLPKEKFNGDSLNGNGPSGYLLTTDEITMYKIEFGWYGAIGLRLYAYIPVENGKARWVVVHTFVIENKLQEPSMGDPFYRFKYEMRIGAAQAPRIVEPQVLYKYGTSMYIDGGDEGTVSVYSQTSEPKNLPFQAGGGNYVSIFGLYPKTNIVSGGTDAQGNNVSIPNKKIIIPKALSITATGVTPGETNAMAEINFTKCVACKGSAYIYMPDVYNGNHNVNRKFKKLPLDEISTTLTLAPIDIDVLDVEDNGYTIVIPSTNHTYIRNGDYVNAFDDANGNPLLNSGHIVNKKYRGNVGDITNKGTGYAAGTYQDVALSGGTGDYLTADIVVEDGVATSQGVTPVTTAGDAYVVNELVFSASGGIQIRVDSVDGTGGILTYTILRGGSGNSTGDVTMNVASNAGTTAAVINIVAQNGVVTEVTTTLKGSNYTVGDQLTAADSDLGSGGGSNFQYTLTAVGAYSFGLIDVSEFSIVADIRLSGETITVQPCFVLTEEKRKLFDLDLTDVYTKVSTTRLWNTYIGDVGADFVGVMPTTANLLGYVIGKRWDLDEERQLDPARIVLNTNPIGDDPAVPADFFGDPNTETFDALFDQKSTMVVSPTPLSGPTGVLKWLENYTRNSTGSVSEWEIGFTPYRPIFDQATGELLSWKTQSDQDLTEVSYELNTDTGAFNSYQKLVKFIPADKSVSLELHPYGTSYSYTGFEDGEDWYGRIAPFTEDFRINTPRGSSSGRCATTRLEKQETTTTFVEQIDASQLTSIGIGDFLEGSFEGDTQQERVAAMNAYKNSAQYFLRKTGNVKIYGASGSPFGGQIAYNPPNTLSYIKFFYESDGQGGIVSTTPKIARFAGEEKTYEVTINQETVRYNIIPIKDNDLTTDVDVAGSVDENGNSLIPAGGFNIAYNGVEMKAWFSGTDDGGNSEQDKYNTPGSYSGGGNNQAVFDFDAFPLYAFVKMRDNARIRSAELHDIDELGNLSTQNPQWKRNFNQVINPQSGLFEGVDRTTYGLEDNLRTGQIDVNGVGDTVQSSIIPNDDVVPAAFQQVSRLSSATIDTQGEGILRPGDRLTTLYINNETKYFDLEDVFGFDRKVLTPDVVNTEAVFIVGRAIGNTAVDIEINITYVEQL